MLVALDHPSFCAYHAGWVEKQKAKEEDLTPELIGPLHDFRSVAAVNYTLGKLVKLVASRRISTREAATITYICQLLLQTVQGVNKEISRIKINRADCADLSRVLEQTASLVDS